MNILFRIRLIRQLLEIEIDLSSYMTSIPSFNELNASLSDRYAPVRVHYGDPLNNHLFDRLGKQSKANPRSHQRRSYASPA
jgi:hypothetical protein